MRKKFLRTLILILLSLQANSLLANNSEVASFNNAYKKYQEYVANGKFHKALPHAKKAYEIGIGLFDEENENTAVLTYNYGRVLFETRQEEQAKPLLETALVLYEQLYGKNARELIDPLMTLGHTSAELGKSRYQKKYYKRALSIAEDHEGVESELYADLMLETGIAITQLSHTVDSKRYYKKAYEGYHKILGADHPKTGVAAFNLGKLELARKHYRSAEKYFLESLNTFEDPDKPSSQAEMSTHAFLIEVYEELDESESHKG